MWQCKLTPFCRSSSFASSARLSPPFLLQVALYLQISFKVISCQYTGSYLDSHGHIILSVSHQIISLAAFFSVSVLWWPSPSPDFFLFSRSVFFVGHFFVCFCGAFMCVFSWVIYFDCTTWGQTVVITKKLISYHSPLNNFFTL